MSKKKLIEVALPLDAINAQSAREKSIRHGHPSTLHLWWARRPLATARAVLFAQLVDDPSEHVDTYRAEGVERGELDVEAYAEARVLEERDRLFDLITRMVDWDNLGDEALFDEVRAEIMRSTDGNPPAILDPFAGGGTIPLEAQRLGLEAHASDLNPVAVLINKALIEIPPKFAGQPPVFPDAAAQRNDWPKASGLAEDVRRYGAWMRDEAEQRIGHLYPKATLPDGSSATVIAWIWARTVTCPNPACGVDMPLVRSWWLSKRKGKETFVRPIEEGGRLRYEVVSSGEDGSAPDSEGTVGRQGGKCIVCASAVPLNYIRERGKSVGLGAHLIATVAEGKRQRHYIDVTDADRIAAVVDIPESSPGGELPANPRDFKTPNYGMRTFSSLFTNRQLQALTLLSELVVEARGNVLRDALNAGYSSDSLASSETSTAGAYADAVATYLAFAVSKSSDNHNSLSGWRSDAKNEGVGHLFTRQAVPMVWDFAEGNPLGSSAGSFELHLQAVARSISLLPSATPGRVVQADAAARSSRGLLISTDPPYYDNIGYSDLSDFFYVWLRRSLREIYPDLLSTILVPKSEELVANAYRHGGKPGAQDFFEKGFERVFANAHADAGLEYPIAVYYAFKQSSTTSDGTSSTGWETILSGMVRAGWTVTATWPVRSELSNRMIASGTNALASSIVLALRPRSASAGVVDRRGFLNELRSEIPGALRSLQQGSIAPVDLAQASIGPGMALFSRHSEVIGPSGAPMTVREALQAINSVLDEVLGSQESDFDAETRWCVSWFEAHGFEGGRYGDAETLANAKNASLSSLGRSGVLESGAGVARLLAPAQLEHDYDPRTDDRITLWEVILHLGRALEERGLDAAGAMLAAAEERGLDMTAAHELAYRLFAIAEKRGMTDIGITFNTLGSAWADVRAAASAPAAVSAGTGSATLDFDGLDD